MFRALFLYKPNYTLFEMERISVGSLIKQELKRQERSVVWFANHLSCDRTNIYRILSKDSIDTNMLIRISKVLNHNFFEDIASNINDDLLSK